MRAIGYFRPASGGASRRDLDLAFSEFCDLNLHQPVATFADLDGLEGAIHSEYRRMLEYMRESGSKFLIVVPNAAHLGNDLESVARSVVELQGAGCEATCSDEEFPNLLQNAFQTLGIKGVSRDRSDRIKESMRARALRGQSLGKPPYGYRAGKDGTLEVVKEEVAVIELIYRLFTKDELGLRLIVRHLNELGTTTRRGGKWNMVTIRDILRNPTYMGTYTRFGLRLPRSHEAIIPPDVFRTAQDTTRSRRPVGRVVNAEPFLLSGIVYCGYCDNKMMGVTRRQTWKRKDGRRRRGVYRYYQCQSRNNQSLCGYHTWRAPLLEGAVLGQLRQALRARDSSSDAAPQRDHAKRIMVLRDDRVRNAERRLVQVMRRAARGALSIGALGGYLDELDDARKGAVGAKNPQDEQQTLANWDRLSIAERQSFLMQHIVRAVVRDDAVEVIV